MIKIKFPLLIILVILAISCENSESNVQLEPSKGGNVNQEIGNTNCETTSLLPHLYAELCLPKGCVIEDSDEYNMGSNNEYKFVKFDIFLPADEVIYVRELAKQDGIKNILEYRRNELELALPETEIYESSPEYFIQKTTQGEYIVHFFKSSYGWPYLLKSSNLKTLNDVEVIIGYLETFVFITN